MFGHMMYFTSALKQPRNERRFERSRPEDFVNLWKPGSDVQRKPGNQ